MKDKCYLQEGYWHTNLFLFALLLTVTVYYAYILQLKKTTS